MSSPRPTACDSAAGPIQVFFGAHATDLNITQINETGGGNCAVILGGSPTSAKLANAGTCAMLPAYSLAACNDDLPPACGDFSWPCEPLNGDESPLLPYDLAVLTLERFVPPSWASVPVDGFDVPFKADPYRLLGADEAPPSPGAGISLVGYGMTGLNGCSEVDLVTVGLRRFLTEPLGSVSTPTVPGATGDAPTEHTVVRLVMGRHGVVATGFAAGRGAVVPNAIHVGPMGVSLVVRDRRGRASLLGYRTEDLRPAGPAVVGRCL